MTVAAKELTLVANTIRGLAMDAVQKADSGHPGMPMGMAEVATVLWTEFLRWSPQEPEWAGRDRFVLDVRPLVHKKLGVKSSLACRPYDIVTALIAQEAGCIVRDPFGEPLDAPLDTTTNVAFACYANRKLADQLMPIVREEVRRHLG